MANIDTPGAALVLSLATTITIVAAIYLRLFLAGQLAALEKAIVTAIRKEFATKQYVDMKLRNVELELGIYLREPQNKDDDRDV